MEITGGDIVKVRDFANKIGMASCEMPVEIKKGIDVIEKIQDIKYLKSNSSHLNDTITYFTIKENLFVIQVK